jgi:hypothetical protein
MIVALYSSVPQSGKSTCVEYLRDKYGFVEVKFAAPIYSMIRELANNVFLESHPLLLDDDIESYITGINKETPWPIIGLSTRQLMQSLGTDWARDMIDKSFWVKVAEPKLVMAQRHNFDVAISDLRFPSEIDMLRRHNAIIIRIDRPGVQYDNPHPSEGLLNDVVFDYTIINNGTLDDLKCRIDSVMSKILR